MNEAERVAADLARLLASMSPAVAATMKALFEAQAGAAPRAALRTALAAFALTHESDGKTWAKRATAVEVETFAGVKPWNYNVLMGDVDGDGDCDFACKACLKNQTVCACAACGTTGPGSYCFACGRELAYSCPKCMAPWAPIPLEEIADAGAIRMVRAVVQETRTSADKLFGVVRAIVSGDVEDDYGTTISPSAIARRIKPGQCLIDIDHQICGAACKAPAGATRCQVHGGPIEGARCTSVTEAKVPLKDGKGHVDTAIVETTFDLRMPRSKMLYDGIVAGTWPELSVLFTYPKDVDAAVRAGTKKQLGDADLIDVPAYTFTARASNPVAKVTEIRTSRVLRQRTAEEASPIPSIAAAPVLEGAQVVVDPTTLAPVTTTLDPLAEAVAAMGKETELSPATEPVTAPAPTDAPAPAAVPPAGGAPELSLASVAQSLTALTEVVDGIRTAAAASQELTPRLETLDTAVAALRTSLEAAVKTHGDTVAGLRTVMTEFVNLQINENRRIKQQLKAMVVPAERVGHSGATDAGLKDALRTITEQQPQTSGRADVYEQQLEAIARLAVGI